MVKSKRSKVEETETKVEDSERAELKSESKIEEKHVISDKVEEDSSKEGEKKKEDKLVSLVGDYSSSGENSE